MTPKNLYNHLCLIAQQLQIKVVKGKGNFKGGACLLREESMVVLNNNQPFEVRVKQLALCLLDCDLSNIQIDQKVQKILMDIKNEKE
tara:strand:+ start:361 stop:621 length:261 start_codon:yes stop_codon:yes gene_type:complete